MKLTAFDIAQRYVGINETSGVMDTPVIMAMLRLDATWPEHDEVPWCSAFVNWIAWHCRLPRSKSLMARSWLGVGQTVGRPQIGWDIVVLWRGTPPQPGPEVLDAQGHVGFFAGPDRGSVRVLGGNQGNQVSIHTYSTERVLGYRRLVVDG